MALKNSTSSFGYTSSDYSYMDEEDDIGVDEIEFYEYDIFFLRKDLF